MLYTCLALVDRLVESVHSLPFVFHQSDCPEGGDWIGQVNQESIRKGGSFAPKAVNSNPTRVEQAPILLGEKRRPASAYLIQYFRERSSYGEVLRSFPSKAQDGR